MRSARMLIAAPRRILMNGRHSAVAVAISLVTSAPALAGDTKSPAFTPRQMAHCMMKRVRVNSAESYRDAFKACKSEFAAVRSDDSSVTAATLPEKPKQ
jgi:hypothetical protein